MSAAEPRIPTYLWLTESAEPQGGHHLRSLGVLGTLRVPPSLRAAPLEPVLIWVAVGEQLWRHREGSGGDGV